MTLRIRFAAACAAMLALAASCATKTTPAPKTGAEPAAATAAVADGSRPSSPGVERRAIGNLRVEGVPEIPGELAARLRQYQNLRRASLIQWHPSGWMLIATRFGNTAQLHRVNFPGGDRTQLTFFDEPATNATFTPDGSAFILAKDVGGSEYDQLYRFDLAAGRATLLTDGKSRNGGVVICKATGMMAFSSNMRNGSDTDVYIRSVDAAGTAKMVLGKGGLWGAGDFAPDGKRLLVGQYVSVTNSMIHILDLASGELTPIITLDEGETVAIGDARFSKSGDGAVYYTTDRKSEFQRLYRRAADGTTTCLTSDIEWDVENYALSDDGRWLAMTINAGGQSELYLMDLKSGTRRRIAGEPGVYTGLSFSPDSSKLAVGLTGPRTPGDIFTISTSDLAWTRWTNSEVGGLDTTRFVAPTRIEFTSFDGLKVDSFYYRPQGDGPFPVIIDFHGGPEGQSRPWFVTYYQFLVNELGIAVLTPNVRGSTGYGRTFVGLDNGFKREDSVKDGGALLDWIGKQPELDASRVGVTGASYGGYMTMAMLTTYPDRVAAGVQEVGISNFVTFLENTADYRRDLRRVEYGDERDPAMREFQLRISPTNNAGRIRSAFMAVQGFNDPRVPWTEAEQIVAAVRSHGMPAWYVLGMNEGHGFARKENSDYLQQATTLFWQTYLIERRTMEKKP